jgi:hypothetical protein
MLIEQARVRAAVRAGAYVAAIAVVSVLTGWSAYRLALVTAGTLEASIIDGSGYAPPEPEWSAPPLATDPRTDPHAAVDTHLQTRTDAISQLTSVTMPRAPLRVSSDAPDADPADGFHNGARGTFKTYCVRLCDGYYFPISFSTTANRFADDAEACQSRCGSPARLFVHPIPGGGPATMVSLDGLPYTALKSAFLFRTKYDAQCRCEAQPWEQASRDRHRLFAAADAAAKGDREAAAEATSLGKTVAAEVQAQVAAREAADKAAAQDLAGLAETTALEPPAHIPSRRQTAARPSSVSMLRVDAFDQDEPPKRGFIPASGSARAWRDRVFSDN